MTKEQYMKKHPGVELTMAPITGGADIQLHDYMEILCYSLHTGHIKNACVFSYKNCLLLIKQTETESLLQVLYGTLQQRDRVGVMKTFACYQDPSGVADDYEDYSVEFFISEHGAVFVPDYVECYTPLHNDGYIRCVYCDDNLNINILDDIHEIQHYLEKHNECADCQSICTTERIGDDIKFEFWYKDEET